MGTVRLSWDYCQDEDDSCSHSCGLCRGRAWLLWRLWQKLLWWIWPCPLWQRDADAEPGYYGGLYRGYGGYGRVLYGKRDADAEPGYYGGFYRGHGGYGRVLYGKRDADAEPGYYG